MLKLHHDPFPKRGLEALRSLVSVGKMTLTAIDNVIISTLSGDLPENLAPYEEIAARIGVSEEELLGRVEQLRRSGVLRRFGAAVDPGKIGFAANAMVVCRVPEQKIEEAARAFASSPAVSHCYQREMRPGWPYNLYAVLHARTRQQCQKLAAEISRTAGSEECKLLFTVRQFKKVSPAYFISG